MRVKVITNRYKNEFEREVNDWLEEHADDCKSPNFQMQYQVYKKGDYTVHYSVMIVY